LGFDFLTCLSLLALMNGQFNIKVDATLAQLVEQRTENPRVRSSILRGGTFFCLNSGNATLTPCMNCIFKKSKYFQVAHLSYDLNFKSLKQDYRNQA
jgi:hypothetical protein